MVHQRTKNKTKKEAEMSNPKTTTKNSNVTPKRPWYKSALLPWIIIILAVYGFGLFVLGWNYAKADASSREAQAMVLAERMSKSEK